MGLEVSGEVVIPDDTHFKVGDRVGSLVIGGGYAEYCTAKAAHSVYISSEEEDEHTMARAATFPETFFTVWSNLFWSDGAGRMRSGENILVHGGSGGIGTMAIRIGQVAGCPVIVTAGSDEKCNVCDSLGSFRSINYNREDFVNVVQDEIGGVDVILDVVGGSYISKHMNILNRGGRHISIGFLQGSKVKDLNMLNLLAKGITLTGSTLRRRPDDVKASILEDALDYFTTFSKNKLTRNERTRHVFDILQPHVTEIFDLENAAEAHVLMESRKHIGKIALRVS